MKGMPKVILPGNVIEVIDHRIGELEKEFPNAKIQNELIGAAATIVVERFIKAGKKIQPDHVKLLYGAIYHNTLNFIATNATKRDRDAAKYLEISYNLNERIIREMFDFATREAENNVQVALQSDAKKFEINNKVIGAYQLIVWGETVFSQNKLIMKTIGKLNSQSRAPWGFVNIVDLESKKSHIFVTEIEGKEILSKVLNVKFDNGWTVLPAILRKQIMPRINEVVKNKK